MHEAKVRRIKDIAKKNEEKNQVITHHDMAQATSNCSLEWMMLRFRTDHIVI